VVATSALLAKICGLGIVVGKLPHPLLFLKIYGSR
jgi:hypothetical protein